MATVLVVTGVAVMRWQPWVTDEIVYRGEPGAQFTGLAAMAEGEALVLRWDVVAGADSYRVSILAGDLAEITMLPPTTELSLRFDPRSLTGDLRPWFWQVTALVDGGASLTSDPQRLP